MASADRNTAHGFSDPHDIFHRTREHFPAARLCPRVLCQGRCVHQQPASRPCAPLPAAQWELSDVILSNYAPIFPNLPSSVRSSQVLFLFFFSRHLLKDRAKRQKVKKKPFFRSRRWKSSGDIPERSSRTRTSAATCEREEGESLNEISERGK